jgi:hypothetical protein
MRPESVAWADVWRLLAAQLAWFQAALLGAAAVDKIVRWHDTQSVVRRFAGIPKGLAVWASAAAVGLELAAAVALVVPGSRAAGAATAALLWSVYLGLLLRAIGSDRRDVDCGCSFGTRAAAAHRRLGAFQVVRNTALVILAWGVAAVSAQGSASAPASQILAAFALLALYAALDQVMALRPLPSGEVS